MAGKSGSNGGGVRRLVADLGGYFRQPKALPMLLLIALTLGATGVAGMRVWEHGRSAPMFQFQLTAADVAGAHPFLHPDAVTAWIETDPFLSESHSIYEPNVTEEMARRLARAPWIEEVSSIRRVLPNRLEIVIIPRVPVARVLGYPGSAEAFLADENGTRLDALYYDWARAPVRLIDLTGVSGSAPAMGERWTDEGVLAGATVARELNDWSQWEKTFKIYENPVVAIDVSNVGRRANGEETNEITLLTQHKSRVKWGRASNRNPAMELPVEEKLRSLYYYYRTEDVRRRAWYELRYSRLAGSFAER